MHRGHICFLGFSITLSLAVVFGDIYFAIYSKQHFEPYFASIDDTTNSRAAQIVFVALVLLVAIFLARVLLFFCCNHCCDGNSSPCVRAASRIINIVFFALGLFGTIYPMLEAIKWRPIFQHGGRADLAANATALLAMIGFSIGLGALLTVMGLAALLGYACCASRDRESERQRETESRNNYEMT